MCLDSARCVPSRLCAVEETQLLLDPLVIAARVVVVLMQVSMSLSKVALQVSNCNDVSSKSSGPCLVPSDRRRGRVK